MIIWPRKDYIFFSSLVQWLAERPKRNWGKKVVGHSKECEVLMFEKGTLKINSPTNRQWKQFKNRASLGLSFILQIIKKSKYIQLIHFFLSYWVTLVILFLHGTICSSSLLILSSGCPANGPQNPKLTETASILFQANVQQRGEKQPAPCDPSPPVLEGPWVINSTLTKSPLARHQAHVVPEQIPFKVYMFHLPVLCSSVHLETAYPGSQRHYRLSLLILDFSRLISASSSQALSEALNISPTSWNPSKIQTHLRASRSYWSNLSRTGSSLPKQGVWHIIANNTNNFISILLFSFFFRANQVKSEIFGSKSWMTVFCVCDTPN